MFEVRVSISSRMRLENSLTALTSTVAELAGSRPKVADMPSLICSPLAPAGAGEEEGKFPPILVPPLVFVSAWTPHTADWLWSSVPLDMWKEVEVVSSCASGTFEWMSFIFRIAFYWFNRNDYKTETIQNDV